MTPTPNPNPAPLSPPPSDTPSLAGLAVGWRAGLAGIGAGAVLLAGWYLIAGPGSAEQRALTELAAGTTWPMVVATETAYTTASPGRVNQASDLKQVTADVTPGFDADTGEHTPTVPPAQVVIAPSRPDSPDTPTVLPGSGVDVVLYLDFDLGPSRDFFAIHTPSLRTFVERGHGMIAVRPMIDPARPYSALAAIGLAEWAGVNHGKDPFPVIQALLNASHDNEGNPHQTLDAAGRDVTAVLAKHGVDRTVDQLIASPYAQWVTDAVAADPWIRARTTTDPVIVIVDGVQYRPAGNNYNDRLHFRAFLATPTH